MTITVINRRLHELIPELVPMWCIRLCFYYVRLLVLMAKYIYLHNITLSRRTTTDDRA